MRQITLTYELEQFHAHLENNPRTILSSAFGNGKTTFLKQYINKYRSTGVYFTLHPVNYSCGTNEDIFEYIKRDLMMQLANKGLLNNVDLDAIDATIFSWDNLKELIGFLLSLAPGGEHLQKLWEKFQPWIENGLATKEEYESRKHTYDKYEGLFTSQRGGIYEHDAYTSLIEGALKAIHNRNPKEGCDYVNDGTILIIEDMDRIDPAHLFRILNVLGAHLDDEDDSKNKFGFKNIILVMDFDITEHIFHHFYGKNANYIGYINKFVCHHVYRFDIIQAARNELLSQMGNRCFLDKEIVKALPINGQGVDVITFGTVLQELSVRDIAHILDDIDSQVFEGIFDCNGYKIDAIAPITILLSIFVRLNRNVNYETLCQHIIGFPWGLTLLQQYLLHQNIFTCGEPFFLGGNQFAVDARLNQDGTSSANIQQNSALFDQQQDVSRELSRCFGLAKNKVKGCR